MSSKRVLVLGGNRFFGKRLVQKLIEQGHRVTLINRGQQEDPFSGEVQRIRCDRKEGREMFRLLKNTSWDLVYDQICYDYQRAYEACEIFEGVVGQYVFTSTASVYGLKASLKEEDFDPKTYKIKKVIDQSEDYGEAKRQAEVAFSHKASFPVCSVRFPVVLGPDDYTQRLVFHVQKIMNKEKIYFPNIQARKSFIHSQDACETLYFVGDKEIQGAINAASSEPIILRDLMAYIEETMGVGLQLHKNYNEADHSPYGIQDDWFMDITRLNEAGLKFKPITSWIEKEIFDIQSAL